MELAFGTQRISDLGWFVVSLWFLGILGLFCYSYSACVTRAVPLLSIVLASLDFLLQRGGG